MGLRHFMQIGGGGFFGMMLTLYQAGAQHSLSPITAETGAVMSNFAHLLHGESIFHSRQLS
jgi:hypothetical protein